MPKKMLPLSSVVVRTEVYEQLWRIVDTARFLSRPPRASVTESDLLSKLADDLKMLERAIGFFCNADEKAARGDAATKHPWTLKIEEEERRSVASLDSRGGSR